MKTTEERRERSRKYYQENREKVLERVKLHYQENSERIRKWHRNYAELGYRAKWYLKKKTDILSHYSNGTMKCAKCGFDDIRALSIDHIDGGGAPHRRETGNDIYGWLKRNGFPEGYQVLCMNCQLIKRQVNRECYIR